MGRGGGSQATYNNQVVGKERGEVSFGHKRMNLYEREFFCIRIKTFPHRKDGDRKWHSWIKTKIYFSEIIDSITLSQANVLAWLFFIFMICKLLCRYWQKLMIFLWVYFFIESSLTLTRSQRGLNPRHKFWYTFI